MQTVEKDKVQFINPAWTFFLTMIFDLGYKMLYHKKCTQYPLSVLCIILT